MAQTDIMQRIAELEKEISKLPPGSIAKKKIRNKEYYYHRYTALGKRKEIYLTFDEADKLRAQIEKRKKLEKELKQLKMSVPQEKPVRKSHEAHEFKTFVRTGEQLRRFAAPVEKYNTRECFGTLCNFVFGEQQDKVFILYGLRRTGKTTMIRQTILKMTDEQKNRAAFIQISSKDTLSDINSDFRYLEEQGYKYIFIDEVTLMEDFIGGAALFSDIYASSGMKTHRRDSDSACHNA